MSLYTLPGHYGKTVDIDVCMDCNAIWFDQWESSQLSPDGVVALFQLINERGGASSNASTKFGEGLRCVSCGDGMKLTTDRVKHTRFTYQACRHGHGRLTTFYNFLSEKQFIRELTQAERSKLAASVKQIKCSSCAAPVDIGVTDACSYCRAPVSVFDRDAAKKAIDHYLQERQKQLPSAPSNQYGHDRNRHDSGSGWDTLYAADLATDLLWALGRAATRGLGGAGRNVSTGAAAGAGAGAVFADSASATTGGLLSSMNTTALPDVANIGNVGLPSATEALFGTSLDAGSALSNATEALSTLNVADSLPSATEALFGSGADTLSSLTSGLGDGAGIASGLAESAMDAVSSGGIDALSGAAELAGDFASSAGDGAIDLVSDGIGSLLGSLFS